MALPARVLAALLAFVLVPLPAFAWGAAAHRYIMRRALDLLPSELAPLFGPHRDEVVIRVNDPDTWRSMGWPDDPNHFLDFGVKEYGAFPFTALPRDYGEALAKFGRPTLDRNGTLPWRLAEVAGNLRRTFEAFASGNQFAVTDAILFSAVAAHYIQDAHQPLHASDNYDGQLTNQRGLHARFERDLFERFETKLSVTPGSAAPIRQVRDAAFDVLLRSYQRVPAMLEADAAAIKGRPAYDDVYYERFFAAAKPLLEQTLGESISATAGVIIGAWEEAGRPPVRARDVRAVERAPQQD